MEDSRTRKRPGRTDPYDAFAILYDQFMDHVPYRAWAGYLHGWALRHLPKPPSDVLDLGCGTGTLLGELYPKVDRVYGLDGSTAMLRRAKAKLPLAHFRTGRLEGPLPYSAGRFAWVVSTHDSLNYLASVAKLRRHFAQVARVLSAGGLYSVDAASEYNIIHNHAGRSVEFARGELRLSIERSFDSKTRLLVSRLRFEQSGQPVLEEVHRQRCYRAGEVADAARASGLVLVATEGNYRRGPLRESDPHLCFHFARPPL